jgi:hypothetical protein
MDFCHLVLFMRSLVGRQKYLFTTGNRIMAEWVSVDVEYFFEMDWFRGIKIVERWASVDDEVFAGLVPMGWNQRTRDFSR